MPGRLLQALQQILHEHLVASTQALGDGCIAVYHGNTTHLLVDGPATFAAALVDAAQRGVDVRLVLPGRSDFELVLQAGRSYYDRLLPAGVCIHEMDDAVMHAKTAVIDGVVSTVGSSNMDWRSFVANHEINAVVLGRDFALQVEVLFRRDLANSRPTELEAWRQRDLADRFMEQVGRLAERLLPAYRG